MANGLGWIGLVCELVGLGIALWGLDDLSKELFQTSPLPHRVPGRWVRRRSVPGRTVRWPRALRAQVVMLWLHAAL
jgi:hypothetical protein